MKQRTLTQSLTTVTVVTLLLLAIPFTAMQFTEEVQWGPADFIVMGLLIFTTGVAYVLITRQAATILQHIAAGLAIGTTFFMIWSNLAVGLIGRGPNWGNFLYLAVIAVVIVGTVLSNFTAKGMERTMFAASLTITLIAVIALVAGMQNYPQSSAAQIVGVNAFFATLYALAGLLFRFASLKHTPKNGVEA